MIDLLRTPAAHALAKGIITLGLAWSTWLTVTL
jgi:hypothetical protein